MSLLLLLLRLFSAPLESAAVPLIPAWGYGYDSLKADLARWKAHPDVRIDSFGASVQGRGIWLVTITDPSDSLAPAIGRTLPKRRILVHARTHPDEVQAFCVAREMIRTLLDTTAQAAELRRDFIFQFVPQYNPDGVELGQERTNANGVDLESNWDNASPEPEVLALKGLFQRFMQGPIPVEVALNLHSDQYNNTRFFVYHVEAGTSYLYTELEKRFIGDIQAQAPGRIEDWNFVTSWSTGTALRYPEGYWWSHHHESVLALTYEDNNRTNAAGFDTTARSLVLGATTWLRSIPQSARIAVSSRRVKLTPQGVRISDANAHWEVRDMQGKLLAEGTLGQNESFLPWSRLCPGTLRVLVVTAPGKIPDCALLPALLR
jgi:Zinc carboxypeptidase